VKSGALFANHFIRLKLKALVYISAENDVHESTDTVKCIKIRIKVVFPLQLSTIICSMHQWYFGANRGTIEMKDQEKDKNCIHLYPDNLNELLQLFYSCTPLETQAHPLSSRAVHASVRAAFVDDSDQNDTRLTKIPATISCDPLLFHIF